MYFCSSSGVASLRGKSGKSIILPPAMAVSRSPTAAARLWVGMPPMSLTLTEVRSAMLPTFTWFGSPSLSMNRLYMSPFSDTWTPGPQLNAPARSCEAMCAIYCLLQFSVVSWTATVNTRWLLPSEELTIDHAAVGLQRGISVGCRQHCRLDSKAWQWVQRLRKRASSLRMCGSGWNVPRGVAC